MKPLLIIGAGVAGQMIADEINRNSQSFIDYDLVGFLDDNPNSIVKAPYSVLGSLQEINHVIEHYKVLEVIIAIPSGSKPLINKIISCIQNPKVKINIVPAILEIIKGDFSLSQIRSIQPVDLLGREEVNFEINQILNYFRDKTVLVTGGAGSIGSEIVKQLLRLPIKQVIALDKSEFGIYSLLQENTDIRLKPWLCNLQNLEQVKRVFSAEDIQIVFHAAAHKHVNILERFPHEAVLNNVVTTLELARLAERKCQRFIYVSTDKAVMPSSVMGASKRLGELIIAELNSNSTSTSYASTRFGNVMGSSGSVIPLFEKQIQSGGPVTVTHKEVTRYFMLIGEAARLVIQSASIQEGDSYLLEMGDAMKIDDLAKTMIKMHGYRTEEIKINYIGLSDSEKLHESLLYHYETPHKTDLEKILALRSEKGVQSVCAVVEEFSSNEDASEFLKSIIPEYNV